MTYAQMKGLAVLFASNMGVDEVDVASRADHYVNNTLERVFTHTKSLVGTLTLTVTSGTQSYSLVESAASTVPAKHWFSFDGMKWDSDEDITHKMISPRHLSVTDTTTDPPFWFIQNEKIYFHPTPSENVSPVFFGSYYPQMGAVTEIVDLSARDYKLFSMGLKAILAIDFAPTADALVLDGEFDKLLTFYKSPYLRQHEQTVRQYDFIGE